MIASRRKELGLSQQELGRRAGLRREKISGIECQRVDMSLDELNRLLDALGLRIVVEKHEVIARTDGGEPKKPNSHGQRPELFEMASFIDGSRAKVIDWGKTPK